MMMHQPTQPSSTTSLKALWPWIAPHRPTLIKALGAIIVIVIALLALGRGIAHLVDSGLSQGEPALLDGAVLICIGITVVLALGSYIRAVLINRVAERIMADLRKAVFRHTTAQSMAWFENNRHSGVLATLAQDIDLIQTVFGSNLTMALRNILVMLGGVTMLVLTSPKLALVMLGVIPLVLAPIMLIGRRLRRQARRAQDSMAQITAQAEETFAAIHTVQAFVREGYMQAQFDTAVEANMQAASKRLALRGLLSAVVIALVFSSIAFVLWIGGRDLLTGAMTAGDLTAFVFYAVLVASSIGGLTDIFGEIQRAAAAADRIAHILAQPLAIASPSSPQSLPDGSLAIDFVGVSFAYESRTDIRALEGIDLVIKPADRIALVGPSGAGKSTMINLILRLIDPTQGQVLIGGIDARQIDLLELRGAIGLVPQHTALFSGTVAENILFGDPDASTEAMIEAATAAHADGFINTLPQGYDTPLGTKGVQLSGGQRQRLSIARALLKNPRILLLDEATSNLDAQSEQAVQSALATVMEGRTTVIIAHRLATVLSADRIIVMDGGRIIATGKHDDLLASSPLYHELASLQLVGGG